MGSTSGYRSGTYARPGDGSSPEPLVTLSGRKLPPLGPIVALPVGRGLRVSRPASGRHGPLPCGAGGRAGPNPPRSVPAIPRGGRSTLVATSGRMGSAYEDFRRYALA